MKRKILIRLAVAAAVIAIVLIVGHMTLINFAERLASSYSMM